MRGRQTRIADFSGRAHWDTRLLPGLKQVFKQATRVISCPKLLQNADCAGASEARVSIENDRFVFEHNGEDFIGPTSPRSAASVIPNNKRAARSAFGGSDSKHVQPGRSGRVVHADPGRSLRTTRFPAAWIDGRSRRREPRASRWRSPIHCCAEKSKNLDEWLKSPVSLLFFKKIAAFRSATAGALAEPRAGPIAESEWMALDEKAEDPFLLVRSGEESRFRPRPR